MQSQTSAKAKQQESGSQLKANQWRAHPKSLSWLAQIGWHLFFLVMTSYIRSATLGETYPG